MTTTSTKITSVLRAIIPGPLLELYRRKKLASDRARDAHQDVRSVFEHVYATNTWGGEPGTFYSGSGSGSAFADQYCEVVRTFLAENHIRHVVDLGCGDFRIGSQLVGLDIEYTGVDIVDALIEYNSRRFAGNGITFRMLDITSEPLPEGEVCLIRQVLQHLSNSEISAILQRALKQYRYIIVTEHQPADGPWVKHNVDKPHGPDTRILDDSGVFLESPPFSLRVALLLLKLEVPRPLKRPGEQIVTFLVKGNG
jgi:hypothetical protein